jgi:hypothetical protein
MAHDVRALKSYTGFHPENRKTVVVPGKIYIATVRPYATNLILDSPGNVVGTTYYDLQSNGSTGHRIGLDLLGGIHYCFMNSEVPNLSQRYLYYGFISEIGDSLPASPVNMSNQDGFAGIDIFNGTSNPSWRNSAMIGYHNVLATGDLFARETGRGNGSFVIDSTGFPSTSDVCIWPSFSIDINDNVQAVATQSNVADGQLRQHIYSRLSAGSSSWTLPAVFDATYNVSPVVASAPISARSAIAWTSPIFQDSNQYDNNVVYVESPDGLSWDFTNGKVNITNYPLSASGDTTLRAFTDVDAVYDFNDNLHIIWNAAYVTRDSVDKMVILYHAALFHWSQASGIHLMYDHPVREWPCDMGAWDLPVAKMSIGCDADSNFLYVVFTRFDPSDYADFDTLNGEIHPCGGDNAMPCGNGELYMTWSTDGGTNWSTAVNLTNSSTPNCLAGNCDNDNWSSLAKRVDNYLHILYVDDKDAGAAALSEGETTQNPVIYLRVPNPTRTSGGSCHYATGDINGNGSANGVDVTYGVNYLKGGQAPPYACDCPGHGVFYVAGDVNGNCAFNGLDISYLVNFYKGGQDLVPCPACPPSR